MTQDRTTNGPIPATDEPLGFVPQAALVVDDLETLRVIADPLRLRIMEAFARDADTPQTVKRVAATLGEGATKLYYHVNLLEERGLLVVTESRVVSGIIEKRYQPVARAITVDRSVLMSGGDPAVTDAMGATIGAILTSTHDDLTDGLRSGRILAGPEAPVHRRAVIGKTLARLSPDRAAAFTERLQALIAEFDAEESADPDVIAYALLVACYPTTEQAAEVGDAG